MSVLLLILFTVEIERHDRLGQGLGRAKHNASTNCSRSRKDSCSQGEIIGKQIAGEFKFDISGYVALQ